MRISDWSSDVCSSDLETRGSRPSALLQAVPGQRPLDMFAHDGIRLVAARLESRHHLRRGRRVAKRHRDVAQPPRMAAAADRGPLGALQELPFRPGEQLRRSEEHTSELQSPMRISYAVFCLIKKTYPIFTYTTPP